MKLTNPFVILAAIAVLFLCIVSYDLGKAKGRDGVAPQVTTATTAPETVAVQASRPPAASRPAQPQTSPEWRPEPRPTPQPEPEPSQPSAPAMSEAERQSACTSISKTAATIMRNRLQGIPMSRMLEAAASDDANPVNGVMRALIVAAYEEPRYSTQEMQERAVQDFENMAFLECIKNLAKPAG